MPALESAVAHFARSYHGYSQWFPFYLRAVIKTLDREDHRQLLRDNLDEEQGRLSKEDSSQLVSIGVDPHSVDGVPHPVLFDRFCDAVGVTVNERRNPPRATQTWRSHFRRLLEHGSPAVAVGALGLGTESVVGDLYGQILSELRRLPSLAREDYVFFELHCHVDDQHQRDLLAVASDLAAQPGGLADLEYGMLEALRLREVFMDALFTSTPGTHDHD